MTRQEMAKRVKPESMAFLVVLAVAGVLLTIVGALCGIENHILSMNVFAALGAAIIGTAISLLMARVFEPAPVNEIYHLLSVSKNSPLIVDDARVRPRRLKYHGYLYSHAMGKPQWKYRVFDFTRDRRPGYLHARVDVWVPAESNHPRQYLKDNGNRPEDHLDQAIAAGHQVYLYDGYLSDPHLVLVGRLDPDLGEEPDVIQIFPFGLKVQGDIMAGLAFLETSDNKHIVTPTILSKVPLTSETEFGPVKDANEQAHLLARWRQHCMGDFRINVPLEALQENMQP